MGRSWRARPAYPMAPGVASGGARKARGQTRRTCGGARASRPSLALEQVTAPLAAGRGRLASQGCVWWGLRGHPVLIMLLQVPGGVMSGIEWNENYSVGNEKLDKQHKEIISIINTINMVSGKGVGKEKLADVLNDLTRYVHTHFLAEETLLISCNYFDVSSQKREHLQFKKQLAKFCSDSLVENEAIPSDIFEYLSTWWMNHILIEDMKYRDFLRHP